MAMPLSVADLLASADDLLLEIERVPEMVVSGTPLDSLDSLEFRPRKEWEVQGKCRDERFKLLFSGAQTPLVANRAKGVCGKCPVQRDCLVWALLYKEEGVWGGMTDSERRKTFPKSFVKTLRDLAQEQDFLLDVPRSLAALLQLLRKAPAGR